MVNPISSAAASSSLSQGTLERRDNQGVAKVVTSVMENEAEVMAKRAESTKVVRKADESQAKPRDEEREQKQKQKNPGKGRGKLADVYV